MEVSAQTTVIGEFGKLSDALIEGPANWMPVVYESPTGKITQLKADTPFGKLARYARIRVARAKSAPNEVVVPLSWHSLEAEAVFPIFTGRLRLSRFPDGTNRLELQGDYEAPGGIIGQAADAAAMNAVAQATVGDFVQGIASVLGRNALGRSVDEQVTSGRLTLDQDRAALLEPLMINGRRTGAARSCPRLDRVSTSLASAARLRPSLRVSQ